MNHSIPDAATPPVTDPRQENPRPLYERLVAALRRRGAAARGVFFASHRELARELECSAGALPPLMARAIEAGIISRRRYLNTFRLTLIDHGRSFGQARENGLIDQGDRSAAAAEQPPTSPAPIAAPPTQPTAAGRARAGVIDRDSAHVEDHDSSRVVGGRAHARSDSATAPDPRPWRALGITSPRTIRRLAHSGISPGQFARLLALKQRERARAPIGCAVACAGAVDGWDESRWDAWLNELEASDVGPRDTIGGGRRPPAHQRERSPARRATACYAEPDYYADLYADVAAASGLPAAPA